MTWTKKTLYLQKMMIDMFKNVLIRNERYKKRLFCALIELHSFGYMNNEQCDKIVQKWTRADDEMIAERLRGVKNITIKLDFDVEYNKVITK